MDDDAILAELNQAEAQEKIQEGRNLKDKAESLKADTLALKAKGLKTEALTKMREYKAAQAQFDAFISENPDVLPEMYVDHEEPPKPKPPAKPKQLSAQDIYDKYHDVDEMNCMKVLEHELSRCKELSTNVEDDTLVDALENRIEMLEIKQDQVMADC